MNGLLHTLLAFALVLGVLIVVHEFGHYLVARLCGVKVLRFSLGFGRPLIAKRFGRDQTEWALAAFPLGGYVKMLDEREGEVPAAERHRSFNQQSLWRRSLIVVAGPIANFVLAICLYWGLFIHGTEELRAIVDVPAVGTPAAEAGFAHGERIVAIDGTPVETWQDLRWLLLDKADESGRLKVDVIDLANRRATRMLDLSRFRAEGWEGDPAERIGLSPFRPKLPPVVGKVMPGSPAAEAGFVSGDRVAAIAGARIDEWRQVLIKVRESAGKALEFTVMRNGQTLTLVTRPRLEDERGRKVGRIGLQVDATLVPEVPMFTVVRYGPVRALLRAVEETWDKSVFSLQMLGRMLTGEVSWRNLSGPVTIADYAGQSAKLGLSYYLKFMALVSISLGVLNLLPIPLLDGGHLMYHAAEAIRRRPLSERAMEISQQIGLALLVLLMAFAFYNDINRLISG